MAFMVDPDELQRAMDEIAARQNAGLQSDASPPPSDPSGPSAGNEAGDAPQSSTQAPAAVPALQSSAPVNNFSNFNPYAGIDYSVIARHEIPREDPYPPPSDNSGVTVATGVDLSQHTEQELRDWGVSEDTIARLANFLKPADGKTPGLKGDAAKAQLDRFNRTRQLDDEGLLRSGINSVP